MIFLIFSLFLFFFTPFFWIAVAFWSKKIVIVGAVLALFGIVWFFSTAFSRFVRKIQATPLELDNVLGRALERVVAKVGVEKVKVEFWTYPLPQSESRLWLKGRLQSWFSGQRKNEQVIFLSQGLLAQATETELENLLQKMIRCDYFAVYAENRIYALTLWSAALKGEPERFRYWFLSFWFYPVEHLLKIVKI